MRRGARQREGLAQRIEQFLLRGRVGELARQRLARIGQRVLHQILALAALGTPTSTLRPLLAVSAAASSARSSKSCDTRMSRGGGLSS